MYECKIVTCYYIGTDKFTECYQLQADFKSTSDESFMIVARHTNALSLHSVPYRL